MPIRVSEQGTDKLMTALAKAQKNFTAAIKSKKNPHLNSNYADISEVIDATLEHLNTEGIALTQHPGLVYVGEHAMVVVTTRLQLTDQWIESDLTIPANQGNKLDSQTIGAALTYAARYAMQNILVVAREDEDGEVPGKPEKPAPPKATAPKPADPKPSGPPKAEIPPMPTRAQELEKYFEGDDKSPETGKPDRAPDKKELKGFLDRGRMYSRTIFPKALGIQPEEGPQILLDYIVRKTGVSDTKQLGFNQWTEILDTLDKAELEGKLNEIDFILK